LLEITIRDWKDCDLDEVASLTFDALQGSPFSRPERTLEEVKGWLSWNHERFPPAAVFLAHIGGGLVGWLTVTVDVKPGTSETWRWGPYISPEAKEHEDGIARGLIRRCIEFVVERGQTRLEACFDRISDATMPQYERYRAWFEAEGVVRVDESAYMRRALTPGEFTEDDVVLPPDYKFMPLVYTDDNALYDCYSRAFTESSVRSFHDMACEERRAEFKHYFRDAAVNEKSSPVVVKGNEIVGFSLIHSRSRVAHLADIGVAPAHRGRGFGREMLMYSLMNIAWDYDTVTLAVDVDNASAYDMYRDVGFDVEYHIITHAWKQR